MASDNLFIGDLPGDVTDDWVMTIFGAYGTILSVKAIPAKPPGTKGAALVRFQSVEEAQWVKDNLNGNMPEGLETPVVVTYARSGGGGGDKGGWGKSGGKGERPAPYGKGKGPGYWDDGKGYDGKGCDGKGYDGKGYSSKGKGKASSWSGNDSGYDFRTLYKGLLKGGALPGSGQRPDEQCVYIKNLPPDTTDLGLYQIFACFGPIAPSGVKAMLKDDGTCTSVAFVDFQDSASAAAAVTALHGTQLPDGTTLHLNLKRPKKGGGKGW